MEFNCNLKEIFQNPITKIDSRLIPEGLQYDRRMRTKYLTVAGIIDEMGIASAKAQGLLKPITTTEKMRNSEHQLYLYVDFDAREGKGVVVGMLKVGRKRLYVFDKSGECYNNESLCVLDFYVHESRQRLGAGRYLFDFMLNDMKVSAERLAIDKPSDKFLSFLKKHYGLDSIVPQTNNFVVFDGFFPSSHISSPNRSVYESRRLSGNNWSGSRSSEISYIGRHAAHKPEDRIGQIIHSSPLV